MDEERRMRRGDADVGTDADADVDVDVESGMTEVMTKQEMETRGEGERSVQETG